MSYGFSTAADTRTRIAVALSPAPEIHKDENFTNPTAVRDYLFTLDDATRMVHLNIAAEVEHGLAHWELIDTTGATRTRVRTTERARMDTTNIRAIQGEWHLRMTLEDATGVTTYIGSGRAGLQVRFLTLGVRRCGHG